MLTLRRLAWLAALTALLAALLTTATALGPVGPVTTVVASDGEDCEHENECEADADRDDVPDRDDNCVTVPNRSQADADGDRVGDACDADDDNDGLDDGAEAAGGTDPRRPDTDGDGVGDGDDACPLAGASPQVDANGDGCDDRSMPPIGGADREAGMPAPAGTHPGSGRGETPATAEPAHGSRLVLADGAHAPPAPVLGRAVSLSAVEGRVTVRRPGSRTAIPLEDSARIPVGTLVDTTDGSVTLTSARAAGRVQRARFSGGRFRIRQKADAAGVTDLVLAGKAPRCGARSSAAGGRPGTRRRRSRLWGEGRGRFRTHGRHAIASVRGTRWLVEETCRGTLVRVARGVVDVRDKRAGRTVRVRKGGRYLARPRG